MISKQKAPTDFFVTGTDTDVGKTVLSSLLVVSLGAGYWKPIQTGRLNGQAKTDRERVMTCVGLVPEDAPREAYVFDLEASPHLAARAAGQAIDLTAIRRPSTAGPLIVEGAGGAMVPINDTQLMLDLMRHLGIPTIIAARTTLGTINHTLLTVEAVRRAGLDLAGVVLIGEAHPDNRRAIEHYGAVPIVGWIPPLGRIVPETLTEVFERHFDRRQFAM